MQRNKNVIERVRWWELFCHRSLLLIPFFTGGYMRKYFFQNTAFTGALFPIPVYLVLVLLFGTFPAGAQQHKVKPAITQKQDTPVKKTRTKKAIGKPDLYSLDTLINPVPVSRTYFHDKIDKEQIAIDKQDGAADTVVSFKKDTSWSAALSYAFLDRVDAMQVMVENMPANGRDENTANQHRIRCLRAISETLERYRLDPKPDPHFYVALIANLDSLIIAVNENKHNEFAHLHPDIYTLDNSKDLLENRQDIRDFLYIKVGKQDPVMIVKRLSEFAGKDYAGDIITDAARIDPDMIFRYATSSVLALKKAVYDTDDSLVHCIVKIVALSRNPLKALPFLGDLYYGRKTIGQIDDMTPAPAATFQNLVRLKIENDTIARHVYTTDLLNRSLNFVRRLDELHETKDTLRFQSTDSLSATALYYIMVFGQDEIYTSSFIGTFKRMIQRMGPIKGNQLMDSLHYDHFRTFIRMCAGYNTLSSFLATMDDNARNTLMSRFIAGLGNGREEDLDDAVDVADAFGSINDPALLSFLQKKVKENYDLSKTAANKKGMAIYSILAKLIEGNNKSGSDAGAEAASSGLDLPPINKVPFGELTNDSGIVYQQVFFYGDKDGKDAYESFLDVFKKDKNWNVAHNMLWTTISSTTGKKVVIYANLPLEEPNDELSITRLSQYLDSLNIHPNIIIHRGHSYHLATSLTHLTRSTKIVILGSCGGYHNLALVLDRSPDAHIISSKQTGVRAVNEPIIKALNQDLQAGKDINWISLWQGLETNFSKNPDLMEKFSDYVPPHKNLGAIFIKAYRKLNPTLESIDPLKE